MLQSGICQYSPQHPYVHDGHLLRIVIDPKYTLTLETDGHGTLSASSLTGREGDTVTLTAIHDDYYRAGNISVTGGTLNGNTFTFGNQDATARATFVTNSFTVSGEFHSDGATSLSSVVNTKAGKAVVDRTFSSDVIPSAWYASRAAQDDARKIWKVTSEVSGYQITLKPYAYFEMYSEYANLPTHVTAGFVIGDQIGNIETWDFTGQPTADTQVKIYSKTITSDVTGVTYGTSACIYAEPYPNSNYYSHVTYTRDNGTWTASGYIK